MRMPNQMPPGNNMNPMMMGGMTRPGMNNMPMMGGPGGQMGGPGGHPAMMTGASNNPGQGWPQGHGPQQGQGPPQGHGLPQGAPQGGSVGQRQSPATVMSGPNSGDSNGPSPGVNPRLQPMPGTMPSNVPMEAQRGSPGLPPGKEKQQQNIFRTQHDKIFSR